MGVYIFVVLTKKGVCEQISVKISNVSFHKNPSGGSHTASCGQTDIMKWQLLLNAPKSDENYFGT